MYDPVVWVPFAAAVVGAGAALTGLLFVAISINLAAVLAEPGLPELALETLALLVGLVIASALVLFPGSDSTSLGIALAAVGVVLGALVAMVHRSAMAEVASQYRRQFRTSFSLNEVATALFLVAGLATGSRTFGGLMWFGVADLIAIFIAVLNAWVLLVEIKR